MSRDLTYRSVIRASQAALAALDLRVRYEGERRVPKHGPVVLAANHVSFPDFLFVGRALLHRRLVRFLCRADIWDSPAGPALDRMRHVPVDREAPAGAYLRARALLRDDQAVCVFPEAGISAAYVVRGLMPGAVALARETGAPLVPVMLWGGQRLWPQKRTVEEPLPRPTIDRHRLVDVRFGDPWHIPPDADLAETTRLLGETLYAGVSALQRLPEHRPRPGEWAPWYPLHLGGNAVERRASYLLDAMPRSAVRPTWGPQGSGTTE